jgi:hypothetical protein
MVSLEMCDEDIVLRVAQMLGAACVQLREPKHASWNVTYIARVTGRQAAEWMRRLGHQMGSRRSAVIDAALVLYHPIRLSEVPITCVVPNCGRPHRSRGLCHRHYMSWSRDRAKGQLPRVTPLR